MTRRITCAWSPLRMHVTSNSLSPASTSPPLPEGRTLPGSAPLYLAGFVAALSALLSVGLILDEDPGFVTLTITLSAIGYVISFIIRRQGINANSVELPAAIVCVLLAAAAYSSDRGLPFL